MFEDDSDYEKECQEIRKVNVGLLGEFRTWLASAGKTQAAIRKHCINLDFYLNHFLLYDDTLRAADGVLEVGNFLGYWFIRKAMWASQASIKSNATSLKEFYAFMVSKGLVEQKELNALKKQIKEEMPDWLLSLGRYNDPEVDLEDVF
jgi:site-specific recombinase XerD